jgi:hypothetical protein
MSPMFHVILRLQEPRAENDELGRRSLQPVIVEPFHATDLWGGYGRQTRLSGAKSPDIVGPLRSPDIDKLPRSS